MMFGGKGIKIGVKLLLLMQIGCLLSFSLFPIGNCSAQQEQQQELEPKVKLTSSFPSEEKEENERYSQYPQNPQFQREDFVEGLNAFGEDSKDAVEKVLVEIDEALSTGAKNVADQIELEELQAELDRLIKENYDDDELKEELEKLRDEVTDFTSQFQEEINKINVEDVNVDTSKVEEELSQTWDDIKGSVTDIYDKVKIIAHKKSRKSRRKLFVKDSIKVERLKYQKALDNFNKVLQKQNLQMHIDMDKSKANEERLKKGKSKSSSRNLRQNRNLKRSIDPTYKKEENGIKESNLEIRSEKSLYPSYFTTTKDNDKNLWSEEEYDIVKGYRELMGFRMIGSALYDAAYKTSHRGRRKGKKGSQRQEHIGSYDQHQENIIPLVETFEETNHDTTNTIEVSSSGNRSIHAPRERLNRYLKSKLKEAMFLELEKRVADGSFTEEELQHIIRKVSSCIPSDGTSAKLDVGSILTSFLHAEPQTKSMTNFEGTNNGLEVSNQDGEASLGFTTTDMIRLVKIILPPDVKESLAKLEIQLVKSGLIEVSEDMQVKENPTPEEIETAILIAIKELSVVSLKLKQLDLAGAIDNATATLAQIKAMKEANPNAQSISFEEDMTLWEVLVQLDDLKAVNEAYYGPGASLGGRSFEVELRNSSILIAVGEMKAHSNEPSGLRPFQSEEAAEDYFDIIYDNSIDLDEIKYLTKEFFKLGETYELTDIGRLMLAIQDYYDVTSFDQINNKTPSFTDYGEI